MGALLADITTTLGVAMAFLASPRSAAKLRVATRFGTFIFIRPGKPVDNAHIENFNGKSQGRATTSTAPTSFEPVFGE
jgi:hypothetical protein